MAFNMHGERKTPMAEINVTPLVDVMLVLLIIFMVTAPMMQEGVSVDLPQAKGAPIDQKARPEEIVISVTSGGNIHVNEKPVPEGGLINTITEKTKESPSQEVYLRADKTVPYGTVVRIIGELKSAGVTNLGMITTPQLEPPSSK